MGALPKSLPRPRLPSKPAWISGLPPWKIIRRRLIVLGLVLVALAAAYLFWFRTSSFVEVETVKITGTEQAPEIESALRSAAEGQSTLKVDTGRLEAAVAGDPHVRGITVDANFPHEMLIDVKLRNPVAFLKSEGVVVAGDGMVLDQAGEAPDGVPVMSLKGKDEGAVAGGAVTGDGLEVARVLGAAPGPLAAEINGAEMTGDYGITVDIGPGLELRFGDAGEAGLKWKAAAAVLASDEFDGAAYLDLSVPDRPVAGGIVDAPSSSDAATEIPAAPDPAATPDPAVDPATGAAIDPVTGLPIDSVTGLPVDPATGAPVTSDPATAVP